MFLNQLTVLEKEAFISLSIHAAKANWVFADEEYAILEEYCMEMGIAFFDAENIKPIDVIVDVFKESTDHNKKIVLLEILGLVYSDGKFDEREKAFVKEYARKIGLTDSDVEKQTKLINKYLGVLKEIVEAID